ncbi:MAG: hypothetical protein ACI4UV_15760 [Victivallales bacterium]
MMKKKTIDSIYDESLGGKPQEKPTTAYDMRSDASWLIYLLFLLFLLTPAAAWMLYNGDPSGVYYVYLLLALFILTAATFYCVIR